MRAALLILVVLATRPAFAVVGTLALATAPARSQDITAEGVVRTVSSTAAILQFCNTRYALDGPAAFAVGKAARDAVYRMLGPKQGKVTVERELKRRFYEVKITGEAQWCAYQRATLNAADVRIFLN